MAARRLDQLHWYSDDKALRNGEPGIQNSFVASLASCLNYVAGRLDPVWLMGASAFAFRIFAAEAMCPSAMSVFDWSAILPEAVEQMGYRCVYVSRLWKEAGQEKEKRQEAHRAIINGIDRGVPAVVWDVADSEWGLVMGYNEKERIYSTLTHLGRPFALAFGRLGKNGINILSVAVPGLRNSRSEAEIIRNSLRAAVAHAEQKEWMDRPKYQDGLPAYDLWATLLDRWAMLIKAGKEDRIIPQVRSFALYYASHNYAARCYAVDYLKLIARGNAILEKAAESYAKVASCLRPVWDFFSSTRPVEEEVLSKLAGDIRAAKSCEEAGVRGLKDFLSTANKLDTHLD
jgi:hypothetical protein